MEPVKDIGKVKRMFAQGQPALVDAQTGHKYSMVARCPKDGNFASVARIERAGQSHIIWKIPQRLYHLTLRKAHR